MKPAATDVIVEGKRGLCGFASTNLRFILSQNRIENVVLAGFLVSHVCCQGCESQQQRQQEQVQET
jgi:nicotinamidase-related amidase